MAVSLADSAVDSTVNSMVGWMAGCWAETVIVMRVGLGAGWLAARMAVPKVGWMAVSLADSTVESAVD